MKQPVYCVGIDVGSTTVKTVVLDSSGNKIYARYRRHYANIRDTALTMLDEILPLTADGLCTVAVTGSGGLNLSRVLGVPFVQEVVAVTGAIRARLPGTDAAIELGGEDAKIIFLTNGVEQRMNGICAGGTGAFIDQMAALLQTDADGLNELAKNYRELYPIAARCGVFAKSDIQPLINDGVPKEDLAASIYQAVVNQTISGLACGRKLEGRIAFLGGPLFFSSELRAAFIRTLKLTPENAVMPEDAHLFAAEGAAVRSAQSEPLPLSGLVENLRTAGQFAPELHRMEPLFRDAAEYKSFRARQAHYTVRRRPLADYRGRCYLGIDAGSTTMKAVLISEDGELLSEFYRNNRGDPLEMARQALLSFREQLPEGAEIAYSCATGYGETLLKDAYSLDEGEVETIAHYYAARFFAPAVDCILDIGGQDMKCIRVKDGCVDSIILNEACSAGCGSFIEQFANSLSFTAQSFSEQAIRAENPVDLGTRCTVFMNSNVKQAQKEGTPVPDIAAGLAYSVIKNALFKVIKLTDGAALGETVVVQGGTFCSDAILRAFELISGREAIRPDIAGLMGAFGAALVARERYAGQQSTLPSAEEIRAFSYTTRVTHCRGCENSCRLTVNRFSNGQRHLSGNRCEKGAGDQFTQSNVPDLVAYKKRRIFACRPLEESEATRGTIGLPRVLNFYEDYPFWAAFFKQLGFRTVLSPFSDAALYRKGMDSIPSESECYPAKLVHGHIMWLVEQGVDTIFYPCVVYERKERSDVRNHYNCPMVISYAENIRNNMDVLRERGIRFLNPFLAFTDEKILGGRLCAIMREQFGIEPRETSRAVSAAWAELMRFRQDIRDEGERALRWIKEHNGHGIVLAGRPYHLDPEVNHGIPEMIRSYGFAVLTEDSVACRVEKTVDLRSWNQWMYHARLYAAAQFVAGRDDLDLIQLNSFGCGVDAITVDQVQELLQSAGKIYTMLKIDEVNNLGAARIRVRSLMAALRLRTGQESRRRQPEDYRYNAYTQEMKEQEYTILCPGMLPFHFTFLEAAMRTCGYRFVTLGNEGQSVVDTGLKYVNNDACYPATIVTGQLLDAVASGKYDTDRLALLMVQTGGGCRASNYCGIIRKALTEMGYGHIPVLSLNAGGLEKHPGLRFNLKMLFKALQAMLYGDLFMRVLYRTRPYEREPGAADALYEHWMDICLADIRRESIGMGTFYRNCEGVIRAFDTLPLRDGLQKPRVGIVGEVLVKFMPLANNHLVELLEEEGAEAVVPDFTDFLQYCFWNAIYRRENLGGTRKGAMMAKAALAFMDRTRARIFRALDESLHFYRPDPLSRIREEAEQILQPGNQCGEGWFLPGEIIDLIHQKVENIVCIQPFGCLPNHIVGKGVSKRIKELYPQANIVNVDYDPSASRVNQLNRIKLMLEIARELPQGNPG